MNFDRYTSVALVAAVGCGALLGGLAIHSRMNTALDQAQSAQMEAERSARAVEQELERVRENLERLNARLDLASTESAALREQLFNAERSAALAARPTEPIEDSASLDGFWDQFQDGIVDSGQGADADSNAQAPGEATEGDRRRRRGGDWADPERRAQMMERVAERIAERSDDPDIHYRLEALSGYAQDVFSLRDQLRNAPDEATREALQAELNASMAEARTFIQGEQAYTLQSLAHQYGITDPNAMDSFVQDMRQTLRSPVFWPMPHVTGESSFGGGRGSRGGSSWRGGRGE